MKIHIGADHAGFRLKETLVPYLVDLGYEVEDYGAFEYTEDDDYPDFVIPLAKAIAQSNEDRGIIIGGSGEGEAMCANRVKNVRAIVYYGGDAEILRLSREDNDANILSLGAKFLDPHLATLAVKGWLSSPFTGKERHRRRITKFNNLNG